MLLVKFLILFYGINYTTNLVAGQDIEANSIFVIIFKIVLVLFALVILKNILRYINGKGKRKKVKKKNSRAKKNSSHYRFRY